MALLLLGGGETDPYEREQYPHGLDGTQRLSKHGSGNDDGRYRLQIDIEHRLLWTEAVDRLTPQGHSHDHADSRPIE